MNLRLIYSFIVFMSVGLAPAAVFAEIDPAQTGFVGRYVHAVNGRDMGLLQGLILPESLTQINEINKDYFDYVFQNDFKHTIPDDFQWTISWITDEEMKEFTATFDYIVAPTHLLIIDFDEGQDRHVSIVRQIVKAADSWLFILPAPKPEMLASFRQRQQGEVQAREKAAALYMDLDDPLLVLELEAMLDKGRRIEAYKRYSERTGVDLATARRVVDLIQGQSGLVPAFLEDKSIFP